MSELGILLAKMAVHDGRAGVEGPARFFRHFGGGHGDMMLLGIGEHAVERAGDDYFVIHGQGL